MELRVCSKCRQVRPGQTICSGCSGPLTLADERLFLGESFGKYRLDAVLGAGGMGVVYRAIHATLNRPAAVKIVLPHLDEAKFQKRFLREAQVLAELKHPNIVEVYDFDVSAWGSPYFVMEYLAGSTLRGLLASRPGASLPADRILGILGEVEAALSFAHRKGVVHRDLKPDNIFIADFDGRAVTKVLDFGIAKLLDADANDTQITATGTVVGTPSYLAPEQILGDPIGPWTDQYALALIVAELVSGKQVRAGKTLGEILREDIRRPLTLEPLPAGVPPSLRDALARATQPDPAARFPDVRSFVEALRLPPSAASASTPTSTVDIGAMTRGLTAEPRARPRWMAIGAVASVLALIVLAGLALRARRAPRGAGAAPAAESTRELFAHRRDIPVPPDATEVLQKVDDTLVLRGGGALYLLPESGAQAATRIPLPEGSEVLGHEAAGRLWVLEGRRLVALETVEQKKTVVVESLPALRPLEGFQGDRRAVSSSGLVALVQPQAIDVCAARAGACDARFSVPWERGPHLVLRLTDKYLAVGQVGHDLRVYRTADGHRVLEAKLGSERIHAIELLDDADLVAVSGWFDHVDVHSLRSGGRSATVQRAGGALGLAWLADHPTLLLSGPSGLSTWRPEGAPLARTPWSGAGALYADGSLVALLDAAKHSLSLFDYASMPGAARASLGTHPIWALETEPAGKTVYAGGSDGVLYVYDAPGGRVEPHALHSDGITDLALRGDLLASTSDDKTVAVWQTPKMSVVWRTKAHGFLVNQLSLRGDPPELWTSSSDGTVKRWAWPQIEEQESLDLRRLLGRPYGIHAIWADPAGGRVLAGTWNHALVVLRRAADAKAWTAREVPVASRALYRAVPLPAVGAVVLVGLEPHAVFLFDLRSERLHTLRSFGHRAYAAVATPGGAEAIVLGQGCALRYAFSREGDSIGYTVTPRLDTRLGEILSAAFLQDRGVVVGGAGDGSLRLLDPRAFDGEPLAHETLPPGP